jgi:hypothetical protein
MSATSPAQRYEDIVLHANVVRLELKAVESSFDKAPSPAEGEPRPSGPLVDMWLTYLTWAKEWRQGVRHYSSAFASMGEALRPQLSEDQRAGAEGDRLGQRFEAIKDELRASLEKEAGMLRDQVARAAASGQQPAPLG